MQRVHLLACHASPEHYLESHARIKTQGGEVIPFHLYRWQRQVLRDVMQYKRCIYVKSRGIGLSWLMAGFALWGAAMRGWDVLIGSRTETVASDLLGRAVFIYESIKPVMPVPIKRQGMTFVEFKNAGKLYSETASENMGRSFHPTLFILDEWAVLQQDDKVTASVAGAVGTEGRWVGFSTPAGYGNQFQRYYHAAQAGTNGFFWRKLHWWDIGENDPRWRASHDEAWYNEQKRVLNDDRSMIAQELDCDFIQSGHPAFAIEDLNVIFGWDKGAIHHRPRQVSKGERVIIAIDPAGGETEGGADDTSITVLDGAGNEVYHEAWQKPFPEARQRLYELIARYEQPTIIVERNALGLLYVDALRQGPWRVIQVEVTGKGGETPPGRATLGRAMPMGTVIKSWWTVSKSHLIQQLIADVESRSFRAYSEKTRFQLSTLARLDADKYSAPAGLHDDCVSSLALARWGYRKGWAESKEQKGQMPVSPGQRRDYRHFTDN